MSSISLNGAHYVSRSMPYCHFYIFGATNSPCSPLRRCGVPSIAHPSLIFLFISFLYTRNNCSLVHIQSISLFIFLLLHPANSLPSSFELSARQNYFTFFPFNTPCIQKKWIQDRHFVAKDIVETVTLNPAIVLNLVPFPRLHLYLHNFLFPHPGPPTHSRPDLIPITKVLAHTEATNVAINIIAHPTHLSPKPIFLSLRILFSRLQYSQQPHLIWVVHFLARLLPTPILTRPLITAVGSLTETHLPSIH